MTILRVAANESAMESVDLKAAADEPSNGINIYTAALREVRPCSLNCSPNACSCTRLDGPTLEAVHVHVQFIFAVHPAWLTGMVDQLPDVVVACMAVSLSARGHGCYSSLPPHACLCTYYQSLCHATVRLHSSR